jgi:hypothetical protein
MNSRLRDDGRKVERYIMKIVKEGVERERERQKTRLAIALSYDLRVSSTFV